jgi:hypothetical protein
MRAPRPSRLAAVLLALAAAALPLSRDARAHCDTMDGPVVAAARAALAKGDPTPVLRWVGKDREADVTAAFRRTLAARKASDEAREVADTWFFETLVRIHRAGEGEPFTGLKPAGSTTDPGVHEADEAIKSGDVDALAKALAAAVEDGVRKRFSRVVETRKRADASVEAGREHVAAYVEFLHYVERLHADAAGAAHGHEEGERR